MTKKKKLKKRKASNKKKNLNKKTVVLYLAISSILTFIGASYAWFTSSDTRENNFMGNYLLAQISEVFTPENSWMPATKVKKEVRVVNTGPTPAVVRLSLKEYMLIFEFRTYSVDDYSIFDATINPYANGASNMTIIDDERQPTVDINDVTTWKKAAENNGTYKRPDAPGYFIAASYLSSDTSTPWSGLTPGNVADPFDPTNYNQMYMDFIPANKATTTGNVEYPRLIEPIRPVQPKKPERAPTDTDEIYQFKLDAYAKNVENYNEKMVEYNAKLQSIKDRFPDKSVIDFAYHDTSPLGSVKIGFNEKSIRETKSSTKTDTYWLYEDGYFYYSQILQPGEKTIPLISDVQANEKMSRFYKGSLYKLHVYLDAHDTSKPVMKEWNLTSGEAYNMIDSLVTP